jgi:Fe2+ transport system protein FeoA
MTDPLPVETNCLNFSLEGFTFFSSGLEREALPSLEDNRREESIFSLTHANAGDRFCIVGFRGNTDVIEHLHYLGLHPGTVLQVVSRSISGSVIISVSGRRLGLGRQMTQRVMVSQV